jgi:hypothetical protein
MRATATAIAPGTFFPIAAFWGGPTWTSKPEDVMHIVETKVIRRKTPPGACVEFIGSNGESIEVELRGEGFADMGDAEIIARAKSTMSSASNPQTAEVGETAGVDQTLDQP